jgi:hypothetical protein
LENRTAVSDHAPETLTLVDLLAGGVLFVGQSDVRARLLESGLFVSEDTRDAALAILQMWPGMAPAQLVALRRSVPKQTPTFVVRHVDFTGSDAVLDELEGTTVVVPSDADVLDLVDSVCPAFAAGRGVAETDELKQLERLLVASISDVAARFGLEAVHGDGPPVTMQLVGEGWRFTVSVAAPSGAMKVFGSTRVVPERYAYLQSAPAGIVGAKLNGAREGGLVIANQSGHKWAERSPALGRLLALDGHTDLRIRGAEVWCQNQPAARCAPSVLAAILDVVLETNAPGGPSLGVAEPLAQQLDVVGARWSHFGDALLHTRAFRRDDAPPPAQSARAGGPKAVADSDDDERSATAWRPESASRHTARMRRELTETTHWVGGRVDAAPDGWVVRGDLELGGQLRVTVRVARNEITVEGELPPGPHPLELTPERGLLGWWRSLNELELGHPELDAAYVVRGNDAVGTHALAAANRLVDVAPWCRRVELAEQSFFAVFVDVDEADTARLVDDVLHAWRAVAIARVEAH